MKRIGFPFEGYLPKLVTSSQKKSLLSSPEPMA
jgi:hypothetical protein